MQSLCLCSDKKLSRKDNPCCIPKIMNSLFRNFSCKLLFLDVGEDCFSHVGMWTTIQVLGAVTQNRESTIFVSLSPVFSQSIPSTLTTFTCAIFRVLLSFRVLKYSIQFEEKKKDLTSCPTLHKMKWILCQIHNFLCSIY